MGSEYNYLEKKLGELNLKDSERIKILEMQKELLLQFLIDSNMELFKLFKKEKPVQKEVFVLVKNHN